jgi:amino acid transporter
VSFVVFFGVSLVIVYVFGWTVDPVTFFGDVATLGAIPISLVYLVSNLALPVYYRRYHPDQFSLLRHLVLPILGVLAIGFPLWGLVQPGQPAGVAKFARSKGGYLHDDLAEGRATTVGYLFEKAAKRGIGATQRDGAAQGLNPFLQCLAGLSQQNPLGQV